jgi:hypothetical protein
MLGTSGERRHGIIVNRKKAENNYDDVEMRNK